jgi:hypothetical protein
MSRSDRLSDSEYRESLDGPMTELAQAVCGTNPKWNSLTDRGIVERAVCKIELLRKMVLAIGMNADLLQAVMEE